jgi:hypothetical protein
MAETETETPILSENEALMSYDCMPYMCLAALYVLSCMFSVTISCLFERRFKSSILVFLFLFLPCNCLLHHVEDYAMTFVLFVLLCIV